MSRTPNSTLIVLGRTPPPLDGQAIATQRFADMMAHTYSVSVVSTSIEASAPAIRKWHHYRTTAKKLAAQFHRHPDAIVVWHSISPQVSGHFRDMITLYPLLKGRHVIAVVHWGAFANLFERALSRPTALKLAQRLDRVVFTQQDRSDACSKWLPPETRTAIPNTLDAEFALNESGLNRKRSRDRTDRFKVLFLSNMIEEKGFNDLAEAARIILTDSGHSPFHFVFAGAWPSPDAETRFRDKIAGFSNAVTVLGPVKDRKEIRKLHEAADAFVLPSWLGEAQPLSVIEALSHGTPVVLADHGGMPAMIEGTGAGILVQPRSPAEIVDALQLLQNEDTWQNFSRAARSAYEDTFAQDRIKSMWLELLEEVSSGESG